MADDFTICSQIEAGLGGNWGELTEQQYILVLDFLDRMHAIDGEEAERIIAMFEAMDYE